MFATVRDSPCGKPVTSSHHRDYLRFISILSSHSSPSVTNGVFLPRFQTYYFPSAGAVIVLQLTFDFVRRSVCAETRCLAGVALLHSEVHHPDTLHPQAGSSGLIVDAAGPCNSDSVCGGAGTLMSARSWEDVLTRPTPFICTWYSLCFCSIPRSGPQILSTSSHPEQISIRLHRVSGLH